MSHRTAIITGAGKRVGAPIARALLDDGWTVVAHVHHATDQVPEGAIKAVADLADPDCADEVFKAAEGLPVASLLINNAARFAWDGFGEFSAEQFDAHMAVNVRAPALLTERFAAQHDGGDALIVNLLDSKLVAANPDYLSYTLSKRCARDIHRIIGSRACPEEHSRERHYGLILRSSGQSEANFRAMHAANPLRRGVEAEDIIDAIRHSTVRNA